MPISLIESLIKSLMKSLLKMKPLNALRIVVMKRLLRIKALSTTAPSMRLILKDFLTATRVTSTEYVTIVNKSTSISL